MEGGREERTDGRTLRDRGMDIGGTEGGRDVEIRVGRRDGRREGGGVRGS